MAKAGFYPPISARGYIRRIHTSQLYLIIHLAEILGSYPHCLMEYVHMVLVLAGFLALLPNRSEGICCHECMHHPKGGALLATGIREIAWDHERKEWFQNLNRSEQWNKLKYYGPFCTFNTCDELISPLLNRCRPLAKFWRDWVIICLII